MVVLRSTTPCVAVNSRSNSNLLTVISMVPAATAASTGIKFVSPKTLPSVLQRLKPHSLATGQLLLLLRYIKCKSNKTSSNSRWRGNVENFFNYPVSTNFALHP
jgi:hypothetical protein